MITLVVFLAVLSFLVLIHEGGHLLAAKSSGVWVHQFAVGFGPELFNYEGKETTYSFKPLLFGGYVRMAGEDVEESEEEDQEVPENRKFYAQRPLIKSFIAFSGPAMNLLAAFLIMVLLVGFSGVPSISIYGLLDNSPSKGKLQVGDRILSIGGKDIYSTRQINTIIQRNKDQPIKVNFIRNHQKSITHITPRFYSDQNRYMIGVKLGPAATTKIENIVDDTALSKTSLQAGDVIKSVEDTPVDNWAEFIHQVTIAPEDQPLTLTAISGDTQTKIKIPGNITEKQILKSLAPHPLRHPVGPWHSIKLGAQQIKTILILTYQGIRMIIGGEISAGKAVTGPVGIANILGKSAKQGLRSLFTMIALISLNLGIINLVPFPALDGSRIGFAVYEAIRGKPIPPEKEGLIHTIGFAILIGLLLFITYQDILKFFR